MQNCLGLYIENNLIKYAKISKDHNNYRIDSFGMKFYDDVEETIKQIVSETYSYKTPIAVNLSDEKYTYANLFNLLSKKDLEKAVETEFDYFCNEASKNRKALEYRHILVQNYGEKDKITSLYAYTDKSDIVRKLQLLDSYSVKDVVPTAMAINNLIAETNSKNCIIVNIEKSTSVTTIINGQIYRVDLIENGSKEILEGIMVKENSYDKAYEICKNTTIYTMQGRNLQIEENEYLEDIMPTLYKIVEKVRENLLQNTLEIETIYITGLAAVINNIDLYFQESFPNKECEILTPFFIPKTNVKVNIKDYIEVNSAVALALHGLGVGIKEMNFKKSSAMEQVSNLFKIDLGGTKEKKEKTNKNENKEKSTNNFINKLKGLFSSDSSSRALDAIERGLIRGAIGLLILFVLYTIFSKTLINRINKKDETAQSYIATTQKEIQAINSDTKIVNDRTTQYKTLIQKIDEANNKLTESFARKNAIPNFLTEIMFNIPKEVQLISITNTSGKTIKIEAQSKEYEQLGYFIAKIKNEAILTNVKSTSGTKQNEFVRVTIEGNLPY